MLLVLLCYGIYKRFDFTESYFTIHSFFTPKIADATILYAHKVLKHLIVTLIVSVNLL